MTLPPFISQNYGACSYHRINDAYRSCIKFILAWQLVVYLGLAACAWVVADVFTEDPLVAQYIRYFIWILPLGYGLQGIIILTNSSFNALHLPLNALQLSVIRLFVFYVPFAYIGGLLGGVVGVFVGGLIANVFTSCLAYSWFKRKLAALTLSGES
jgi:Na+-driven multidrug efflux pump